MTVRPQDKSPQPLLIHTPETREYTYSADSITKYRREIALANIPSADIMFMDIGYLNENTKNQVIARRGDKASH
jgi:Cu2+-containing amine oxidase